MFDTIIKESVNLVRYILSQRSRTITFREYEKWLCKVSKEKKIDPETFKERLNQINGIRTDDGKIITVDWKKKKIFIVPPLGF